MLSLIRVSDIDDDVDRFISVVKWFLSGWHIKPKVRQSIQRYTLLVYSIIFTGC